MLATCRALASLEPSASMNSPITAAAPRPPSSFTKISCPNMRTKPLEAHHAHLLPSGEDRPSCPGARRLKRLEAHSLSIAENQIWKVLTTANPPSGEPLAGRDGIRNSFKLFSFLAFSNNGRLGSPLV